jgi:hypothetical protein
MSPSAARAANIANAPLPNAYNAALVGVWCLVAGVVKHLAGLGAFAYFYATRTDTADMLNPSTWGATELVLMGAAVTAGQFLINVVLFAVDACTKTLGPGVVGRIPISGHHLDELDTKDRLMVLINAIQTVPFTYHVACYVWASPRVEWAPEKLTLVNGPVAFLGFFVIYDLFYSIFHRVLHHRLIYKWVHKHVRFWRRSTAHLVVRQPRGNRGRQWGVCVCGRCWGRAVVWSAAVAPRWWLFGCFCGRGILKRGQMATAAIAAGDAEPMPVACVICPPSLPFIFTERTCALFCFDGDRPLSPL